MSSALNLQELVACVAVVDNGMNVSRAAAALGTSQPLVSRHLIQLERRLGVHIFYRSKKRLTGLTRAGEAVLEVARRVKDEIASLDRIGDEFAARDQGDLVVATNHTYARYFLPAFLRRFNAVHPNVRIILKQGTPLENAHDVAQGDADLLIATAPPQQIVDRLVMLPFAKLPRVVLTPAGHPLQRLRSITLRDIAAYPIITYSAAFSARMKTLSTFEREGIKPNVVLSATDADVIKTYVRHGMGIAIVSTLAYSKAEDQGLESIDASHLFEPNVIHVGLRRHSFLRGYTYDFIQMIAPRLSRAKVERALEAAGRPV